MMPLKDEKKCEKKSRIESVCASKTPTRATDLILAPVAADRSSLHAPLVHHHGCHRSLLQSSKPSPSVFRFTPKRP